MTSVTNGLPERTRSGFPAPRFWLAKLIAACVFIEQVGYGLGFTAYTLYLVSFSHGERSTSVFSFCTAFQYLGGVMLPGMVSGWMSDMMGYSQFFIAVMGFCLVTFAVTALLHLPEEERV